MALPRVDQKMVISSRLDEVCRVEEAVLGSAETFDFSEGALFAIKLALEEALANAIKHGNDGNPDKKVFIDYTVDNDLIKITIRDEGCGFDPNDVPDPTLDENLAKPSGRGVLLIRAYMDDVHYNDKGNAVTMIKRCRNTPVI